MLFELETSRYSVYIAYESDFMEFPREYCGGGGVWHFYRSFQKLI